MAEPTRSVKKREDGSKVITRTTKSGGTVRKVRKDGKLVSATRTTAEGKKTRRATTKDGGMRKTVTRTTKGGATVSRSVKRGKSGRITGTSKTKTKDGTTTKSRSSKGSAVTKTMNKIEAGKGKAAKKVHNLKQQAAFARKNDDPAKAKRLRNRAKNVKNRMVKRIGKRMDKK